MKPHVGLFKNFFRFDEILGLETVTIPFFNLVSNLYTLNQEHVMVEYILDHSYVFSFQKLTLIGSLSHRRTWRKTYAKID